MTSNGERPKGINKKKMRKLLYIYLSILLVIVFSSRTIYNISLPRVVAAMPQTGWLTKEIEARGVVEFAETFHVFAASNGWIDDIFVSTGALVDEGALIAQYSPASGVTDQALAELGFAVERVENQLEGLRVNRSGVNNSLQSLGGASPEDLRQHQWAVDDAITEMERLQAELYEAQELAELTNDLAQVQADTIAQRDWNRLVAELQEAQAELLNVEIEDSTFDDFIYQQNIEEAAITLERRVVDLQAAEAALDSAIDAPRANFDNFQYQQVINAARIAYDRTVADFDDAQLRVESAWYHFNFAIGWDDNYQWLIGAQTALREAQNALAQVSVARDEARNELNQATETMRRAQNAFNDQAAQAREQLISNAEQSLTQAQHAFEDATRAYNNAITMLARARDFVANAAQANAELRLQSAQTRVENALTALEDNAWNAQQNIRLAETRLEEAGNTLSRAEENLGLAQGAIASQTAETRASLELELQRIDTDIERVNIDLRAAQLSYYTASNSGVMSIIAGRTGRVISIEKRGGQTVSRGDVVANIGVDNGQFAVEFMADALDANFIDLGDEARIYVGGSSMVITATVYSITPTHDALLIRLIIETDQLNGGEYVRIRIRKQTGPHNIIVPNSAVFPGAMGQHYVWIIRSRFGPLGTEYYSVRVNVLIADSDDFNTAISRGLEMMGAPVITGYSQDLNINGRVRRME